jgi:hypothetical protein
MVQLTIHLIPAGDADIMLAAVTAHDKCYVFLFHVIQVFLFLTSFIPFYCPRQSKKPLLVYNILHFVNYLKASRPTYPGVRADNNQIFV